MATSATSMLSLVKTHSSPAADILATSDDARFLDTAQNQSSLRPAHIGPRDDVLWCHICRLPGALLSSLTTQPFVNSYINVTTSSGSSIAPQASGYCMVLIECCVCRVRVHSNCYGITHCNTLLDQASCSRWQCEACRSDVDPTDLTCVLCCNKVGISVNIFIFLAYYTYSSTCSLRSQGRCLSAVDSKAQ